MVRILIADDRELVRKAISQMIRQADANWEVCGEAADGKDAVNKAANLAPDLVILDVAMPEFDGISATRQIRKLLPDVPILIYTFLSFPHLEAAAKQAGAQGVVQKGDSRALLAEIRKVLSAKTTADASMISSDGGAAEIVNLPSGAAEGAKPAEIGGLPEVAKCDAGGDIPPASENDPGS